MSDVARLPHAAVDQLRSPHGARLPGHGGRGSQLLSCANESAGIDRGDCLHRNQLVWRQPGWNSGTRSSSATSALWILRRPHDRYVRSASLVWRPRAFRLYDRQCGDRIGDRLFHALHRVVFGDPYDRRFPPVVWCVGADRVASSAHYRSPRPLRTPDSHNCRQAIPIV